MSHTITLPTAVALLLGANIGSCIMGLIASIRLSRASKQASIAQILINVIGVLFFLPFISQYAALVSHTSASLPRQIANAHTIFNLASSIALFPFVRQIARVSKWLVPVRPQKEAVKLTAYIDDGQHTMPPVALAEALRELNRIGETTAQMLESGRLALVEENMDCAQWVLQQEQEFIDPLCNILSNFLNRLMQESLSIEQQKRCFQLKNLITDIERVGDLTENLAQAAQKKVAHHVTFSAQGLGDLNRLFKHAHDTYADALTGLRETDRTLARRACCLEEEFDALYLEARQAHIDRIDAGVCAPEASVIFVETLRHLERICDHADNLGVSVQRN